MYTEILIWICCLFVACRLPDDVYVAPLRPEHATLIDREWPHRSAKSEAFIRTILTLNDDGIGLFEKNTDQLLSWVFATENFTPGYVFSKKEIFK